MTPGSSSRSTPGRPRCSTAAAASTSSTAAAARCAWPRRDDWLEIARLIDALPEIGVGWVGTGDWYREHTSATTAVHETAAVARLFSRHQNTSFDVPELVPWWLETLAILHGGRAEVARRHPVSFLFTPVSPLIVEGPSFDTWLAMRGWDIPVMVMPMPLMGATSPGSRLGTILSTNCELLGMLCLVQAAEPGTPYVYAPIIASVDPRSGRYAGGAALTSLSCGGTEMARHYDLPVCSHAFSCDAWVPGAQAGYEKAFGMLLAGLSWPDILVGPGVLGGGLSFGLEQLVIDVEIWRMCRAAHDGIATGADRWLEDVLESVGPAATSWVSARRGAACAATSGSCRGSGRRTRARSGRLPAGPTSSTRRGRTSPTSSRRVRLRRSATRWSANSRRWSAAPLKLDSAAARLDTAPTGRISTHDGGVKASPREPILRNDNAHHTRH